MIDYSDAPSCVQEFLNYKRITQNRSEKTVFQYYHDLRTFGRYLLTQNYPEKYKSFVFEDIPFSAVDNTDYYNVKSEDVFNFISFTANKKNNQVAARQRKISCIKTFYKYLINVKHTPEIKENPALTIDAPSKSKKLPKYLTLDESVQLLQAVDGPNSVRDFCIITLFLNCGMRVSELCGINLSDLGKDFETVNVTGKGSKERIIYLNTACKEAIKEYLKVRPEKDIKYADRDALFITRNHNRISVQTVQWLIYKHLKQAGLENKHMSVHKLRHTAATLMYQIGKTDVRVLKDILGHEQLSTTQIYTHLSNEQIKDAVNSNPLANVKKSKVAKKQDEDDNDEE